jgi:hypothetical protein
MQGTHDTPAKSGALKQPATPRKKDVGSHLTCFHGFFSNLQRKFNENMDKDNSQSRGPVYDLQQHTDDPCEFGPNL